MTHPDSGPEPTIDPAECEHMDNYAVTEAPTGGHVLHCFDCGLVIGPGVEEMNELIAEAIADPDSDPDPD